jgi:hypothetical protein
MGTETYNVSVSCANGTTSAPAKINVNKAKGTKIVINWNANGNTTFPTSGFFSWKSGSPTPGKLPTRSSDGKQLTLEYDLENTVTWKYNIKLENCAQLDPDIENQVPPTPDPDEPPQGGGGGGQPGGGQPGGGQPGGGGGQPGGGGGRPGGGNPAQ